MYAQTDTRANRTVWFGGTPWQKNAPIATFWNNSPVKDAANVEDADAVFRRARTTSACRSPSRSRCTGRSRATACRRISTWRRAKVISGSELRHQIFKANTELEWFERYVLGGATYVPEQAAGRDDAGRA